MWGIVTKKIGRVAVKEQGKCGTLLFIPSLELKSQDKIKLLHAKTTYHSFAV
jgi:hypothetical protein